MDEATDERQRYTAHLQRKAQAYVTQELGLEGGGRSDLDRQVAMVIQHAMETTGARRVTLMRPVSRSQRWHTVSLMREGGYYYGLIAPDALVLPMVAYVQRRAVLLAPNRPHEVAAPGVGQLGYRSYLGLPLIRDEQVLAVLEVVDVDKVEALEDYSSALQGALSSLIAALSEAGDPGRGQTTGSRRLEPITDAVVLDLVMRPPVREDDTFEVREDEWALLAMIDGERALAAVATSASLSTVDASAIASSLLERGLLRIGREERRR